MAKRSYSSEPKGLSDPQQGAIMALLQGKSDQDAADSVGVDRASVAGWRLHDPAFITELNRRRLDLWGAQIERLRSLVNQAVGVLESDLKNGDDPRLRQSAAVHILKAANLYGISEPDSRISESRIHNFDF